MSTAEFLQEVRERGIVLEADGDTLRYRAPRGRLTSDLLAVLKARKPEILQALRGLKGKARVRGQDVVTETAQAEVCFHCHGEKACRCALCAVPGGEMTWREGQCKACRGTGYLAWTDRVQ